MKTYDKLFKALFIVLTVFVVTILIGVFLLAGLTGAYGELSQELSRGDRVALIVVGIVVLFILMLYAALGTLVYRDAKKLGMNAWMWILIAIFAPNGVGFIIYLIFRFTEKKKKHCSSCGKAVSENFSICPNCGENISGACPECSKAVEKDWKVCPYCRHKLKE